MKTTGRKIEIESKIKEKKIEKRETDVFPAYHFYIDSFVYQRMQLQGFVPCHLSFIHYDHTRSSPVLVHKYTYTPPVMNGQVENRDTR